MYELHVSGTVHADGTFAAGWWSASAPGTVPLEPQRDTDAEWAIVALGAGDGVLARKATSVVEVPLCPGGSRLELRASLALPDPTSAVAIVKGDQEMFRRTVPEPARLSLHGDFSRLPRRELIEVPVDIHGPAPGSGAYMIPVWETSEGAKLPLGLIKVGMGEPPVVRLDLRDAPGGDGCHLTVIYFDGVRSVEVSSEPLSIERRPAAPVIEEPEPEAKLFDDGWLSLKGHLEGDGDPEAFEWLIDGALVGTGGRAGVACPRAGGSHTITLQHGTAHASVKVTILPAPAARASPPLWAPPWRSRPFRMTNPPD
jgi:hypothetical protein